MISIYRIVNVTAYAANMRKKAKFRMIAQSFLSGTLHTSPAGCKQIDMVGFQIETSNANKRKKIDIKLCL